jgi:hypothetical protein
VGIKLRELALLAVTVIHRQLWAALRLLLLLLQELFLPVVAEAGQIMSLRMQEGMEGLVVVVVKLVLLKVRAIHHQHHQRVVTAHQQLLTKVLTVAMEAPLLHLAVVVAVERVEQAFLLFLQAGVMVD